MYHLKNLPVNHSDESGSAANRKRFHMKAFSSGPNSTSIQLKIQFKKVTVSWNEIATSHFEVRSSPPTDDDLALGLVEHECLPFMKACLTWPAQTAETRYISTEAEKGL
jgi:hypothetical protein